MNLNEKTVTVKKPYSENRLLNPIERITEILFGLVMALSFTCAISVTESDHADVKQMLFGAIGCNIAWGVIDAIMCLMIVLSQRGRDLAIIQYISKSTDEKESRDLITEAISPEFAAV